MRSSSPIDGNPWPHEMVISIDDSPHRILELLWVREAWGLRPLGDLPPLLVDTPPRSGEADDRVAWEDAWPEVWTAVSHHAATVAAPSLFEELRNTADGSPERAELLLRMLGPSWRDRFGDTAFDENFRSWSERGSGESRRRPRRTLEETPERISLDALIPAWKAGLAKIITIPCHGQHTRILGDSALLMTASTRDDPARYSAALETFTQKMA